MKKQVLLLLLAAPTTLALAQAPTGSGRPTGTPTQQPQSGTGRVLGVVLDAATKQPVPYATVVLLNAATKKAVDGTSADDNGKFSIPRVAAGTFIVQVSFIGYKNFEKPGIVITDDGNTVNLGSLSIESTAQALKEVVVEGQRALIEEKVDRTVYNAEKDETTRGGDATDVLRRVPLLSVDLDGNVSLRGSSNIRVLINNRPSTISANSIADALKQIPADQIKSVEVITSPSAKYDAEGSGGIINIVTKQNNLRGFTLDTRISAGSRSSNLGLSAAYRTGKMGFSFNAGGRGQYNTPGRFENEQLSYRLPANNDPANRTAVSRSLQQADTRQNNVFGRYSLGWDYEINKLNFVAASVQIGQRDGTSYQDDLRSNTTFFRAQGDTVISSLRDVKVLDNSITLDATLSYTRTFEKPRQEFSVLGQYSRNVRTNNFTNAIREGLGAGNLLRNVNDSYNEEYTLQADYITPIKENQILEFGAKDIVRRVNSDYTTLLNGQPQEGRGLSNIFTYDQNVAAAYAAYTLTLLKNYTFKPGVRYEYTSINADFKTEQQVEPIPSYGVLVPSLNLSRKLANGNLLKAAYNRRIQRPSLQFLNPNRQASNPLLVTIGNPELRPEYTNNYELAYNTFVKQTSLNFSVFARNTTGSIQPVRTTSLDTIITRFDNIGTENAYGGSLSANVNINKKFTLSGGTDVFYAVLDNNSSNPELAASNSGWVASGRLNATYTFDNGWGFQSFAFYRGRQVQLQGYQGGFGIYSLSVKKDFAEKRGSFGIGADNFFTPEFKIRSRVESPVLDQNSVNVLRRAGVRVNLSYRIGKLTTEQQPRRRRRAISNDDLKEGGTGTDTGGQQ
ncbi:TonB-dependent receptor domain-containing protein [Hymenobacter psychrophilus]|uniref:Outer membrane receptor proteins, mostly Fe transport n=1 Tax=Hymenobacter psychrophilus TaxID=651662 RepID=A0A1H3D2H3_9BACT|nr:outer membrane beta-barrel family protein [Hymenobacter psychrophilus]SDX60556.1 Outer membrane receptor proteins, mostly Fe transport [Hymenobacter psychrophilus]